MYRQLKTSQWDHYGHRVYTWNQKKIFI